MWNGIFAAALEVRNQAKKSSLISEIMMFDLDWKRSKKFNKKTLNSFS